MRDVYVAGGTRTPFVKSFGAYAGISTQQLQVAALQGLVEKFKLQGKIIGDVGLGAVINSSNNWNMARECVLNTALHPYTPGYTLQRACGTSLETALQLALKIGAGQIETGIAAGVDTNSDIPVLFPRSFSQKVLDLQGSKTPMQQLQKVMKFGLSDIKPQFPGVTEPQTGKSMGDHCEMMVKEWEISREDQDKLAFESHRRGALAYEEGFYNDLVMEYKGLKRDAILRADTTMEKLASLKPAFDKKSGKGTLTAGNSTPLTDGSSATLLVSEKGAKELNVPMLAKFVDAEVAALDFVGGDGLLMAPARAVGIMLERNKLKLQDFDFYEIHEAFAGQVLCTLKAWESDKFCKTHIGLNSALGPLDRNKMNVKGGSVAIGHPFAATGARIVAGLAKMLNQAGPGKRGLISICTAGGMGVAAILES